MNFFRKIPLPGKLFLLVLFPMILIIVLSLRVYHDNNERVRLIRGYLGHIELFADLSATATQLQLENRGAFLYTLKRDSSSINSAKQVRSVTDSMLRRLDMNRSVNIRGYRKYTLLEGLDTIRHLIDTAAAINPDHVLHFYTTAIFRVKTLAQSFNVYNHLVDSVFSNLTTARIMNDIFMYLAVIRTNFYHALFRQQDNKFILAGLRGSYDVLRTYENELLQKASRSEISSYTRWRNSDHVSRTFGYINTVFDDFSFLPMMDAEEWWKISGLANDDLRVLQEQTVDHAIRQMNVRLQREIKRRDIGLFIMILSLLGVLVYMYYTSSVINSQLNLLDEAARKIAVGEESRLTGDRSNDVIGRLGASIEKIDFNNRGLAFAATQIGKGDFNVDIRPRGDRDLLGHAIIAMKEDLKAYIDEIREHERRKDDFIVMASHELKTPITSIKGYVQLLFSLFHEYQKTRVLPPEQAVSSSLNVIEKQINKLTRLLSELLDLSRIERGKLELEKREFDMGELLTETIDEIRQTAPGRLIEFSKYTEAKIFGDRDRIGQVMLNLLSNALKYSQAPDPVIVELTSEGDEVTVSVSDTGIGIGQKEQEKIFERFYRVEGKSEQTYPGFGIGLYIAHEIITRHGGTLQVRSEKGKGSIFEFTLKKLNDEQRSSEF